MNRCDFFCPKPAQPRWHVSRTPRLVHDIAALIRIASGWGNFARAFGVSPRSSIRSLILEKPTPYTKRNTAHLHNKTKPRNPQFCTASVRASP